MSVGLTELAMSAGVGLMELTMSSGAGAGAALMGQPKVDP